MPEACEAVMGSGVEAREEDDEYDEAIRRRRQQVTLHVLLRTKLGMCHFLIVGTT